MPVAERLTEELDPGKIATAQQVREAFDAILKGVREQPQ